MGFYMRKFASLFLIFTFLNTSVLAKSPKKTDQSSTLNINELALPSEVDNLSKKAGSVFYSPSIKGKVLMPVHFWGHLKNSGLHFIPIDTNLINGISLAGGPMPEADYDEVQVTTSRGGKRERLTFDIEGGGDLSLEDFKLKPGDTVFIPKDDFKSNRTYYTSLIGVVFTVLSSILIYQQVK